LPAQSRCSWVGAQSGFQDLFGEQHCKILFQEKEEERLQDESLENPEAKGEGVGGNMPGKGGTRMFADNIERSGELKAARLNQHTQGFSSMTPVATRDPREKIGWYSRRVFGSLQRFVEAENQAREETTDDELIRKSKKSTNARDNKEFRR